jgi:hypothetical protein
MVEPDGSKPEPSLAMPGTLKCAPNTAIFALAAMPGKAQKTAGMPLH